MDKKIKRFYLMPSVWGTVTRSQVFNWVKMINQKGIDTDCISITNIKRDKNEVTEIEEYIGGWFLQINYFRIFILDFYLFIYLFYLYVKNIFKYDKIIFQTRLSKIALPIVLIGFLPRVKIIYEARGAATEERTHVSRNRKTKNFKFKLKTHFLNLNERCFMKFSNRVICVSNTLKNYYQEKYNLQHSKKFIVFPGAADTSLFYLDLSKRNKCREELNYNTDDIVVVYSGKLIKDWEIPDSVFNFISDLISLNEKIKFLVITPDLEIANKYCNKYNLKDKTIVLKTEFNNVNKYLNAADLSLMLREDVLMNNVASPTKFSEYMLAGLPSIMSKGVYDFKEIINETGYGVVLSDYNNLKKEEYKQILNLLELDREKISFWGKNNLSKEILISKYFELLKNV